jgi:hypothetical protein
LIVDGQVDATQRATLVVVDTHLGVNCSYRISLLDYLLELTLFVEQLEFNLSAFCGYETAVRAHGNANRITAARKTFDIT